MCVVLFNTYNGDGIFPKSHLPTVSLEIPSCFSCTLPLTNHKPQQHGCPVWSSNSQDDLEPGGPSEQMYTLPGWCFQPCEKPHHQRRWLAMLPTRQILDPWIPVYSLGISTLGWSRSVMWRPSFQSMAKLWAALCIKALPLSSMLMKEMPELL